MFTFALFLTCLGWKCATMEAWKQEDSRSRKTQGVAGLKEQKANECHTFALSVCRCTLEHGTNECRNSKRLGSRTLGRAQGANKCLFAIWRACKKGYPPPFGKRPAPSTPIIFRTKNTEKSRLGKIGKNFGKNLRENVSGKEKAPNLVERGAKC